MSRGAGWVSRSSGADSVSRFMVGVPATTVRGQTAAQSIAATEAACGHQSIQRFYQGSAYTDFMTSNGQLDVDMTTRTSVRTSHLSWMPLATQLGVVEQTGNASTLSSGFNPAPLQAYLAGTGSLDSYGPETQANIRFLLTIPRWHRVILTPWHEVDNSQNQVVCGGTGTAPNYSNFKNGWRVLADIVHTIEPSRTRWLMVPLLQAYAWKGLSGAGRDPWNFWPAWGSDATTGLAYVDGMGVDVYNEHSLDGLQASTGKSARWDSFGCSIGTPITPAEIAGYNSAYGAGVDSGHATASIGGYKTSDSGPVQWTGGFMGWCEAFGITKMVVGEIGTQRNIENVNPDWCTARGVSNSKDDWIREIGWFCSQYNRDPRHKAKFIAIEYFMSAGRTYGGDDYLSNTIHYLSTGLPAVCQAEVKSLTALNTLVGSTANTTDLYYRSDINQIWRSTTTGTPTWTNTGSSIEESWQLWWKADGSGWDGSTSSYGAWADVTAAYGI